MSSAPCETIVRPGGLAATSRYRWALVGMLWCICFLNYGDRVAIASVFPILRARFHFSAAQLGIIGSAFSWIYAGAAPFAGRIGDRFSRKRVIIGGLYVWSLVTGFTGLCGKFWQFVAVRATEGFGETFYMPASVALISDYHGLETRSRAIGAHQTSLYAGTVFGGAVAGWMAARYGWQSPFLALGSVGILLGLVLARYIREPARSATETYASHSGVTDGASIGLYGARRLELPAAGHANHQLAFGAAFGVLFGILVGSALSSLVPGGLIPFPFPASVAVGLIAGLLLARRIWEMFGAVCASRTALLLLAGFVGTNSVALVFLTWAPTYLHDVFHVPVSHAGLLGTAPIQIGSMAGAIAGGMLADRLRLRMKGGRIFVQGLGTLLGVPFLALAGMRIGLDAALVALGCFGFAKGIHDANICAGLFDVVAADNRAAAVGLLNFVGWGAGAIWTIAFGSLLDQRVPMGALIRFNAAIYGLVCIVFFYAAIRTAPGDMPA